MHRLSLLPLVLLPLGAVPAVADDGSTSSATTASLLTVGGTISASDATLPTGPYITYSSTRTLSDDSSGIAAITAGPNSTTTDYSNSSAIVVTLSTSNSMVTLSGGNATTTSMPFANSTANSTSSATSTPTPIINTRPCNGWAEFCARNYSNITMVAAHNSPFVKPGNVASNQALPVLYQLDDGIRMLQMQTHYVNGTIYLCHTSCDLLNMGTLEDYLSTVSKWMKQHPYDVVTFLIGNGDYIAPSNFTAPIENSGLGDLIYTPSKIPMGLDDWPTLSSMILSGKRAVFFLDYQANQTEIPWLMDEFSQMWETPFSPTNRAFPCTVQRPPNLPPNQAASRLYMANHNLNIHVDLNIGNVDLLIPDISLLNVTNNVTGYGSLGDMAKECAGMWHRPPNFLLVDYYNYGNPNGSVFQVAAQMNNVSYDINSCCGTESAAPAVFSGPNAMAMLALAMMAHLLATLF